MTPAANQIRRWRESPATMVRELFKTEPDLWQVEALEAFPHKQRMALLACRGPGKLEAVSTVVETPAGPRRWGDLRPGDTLFAEDGAPTIIRQTFPQGIQPIYRVTFDDGSFARVGLDHLWKVKGRTERRLGLDWAVISTAEIIKRGVTIPSGDWRQKQFLIPTQGPVAFPPAQQPLDPYLVGVWIGDGHVGEPVYSKPDQEVEDEINRRGHETIRREYEGQTARVRIRNSGDGFRALECFKLKSPDRFIPENYKRASIIQRADLLRGLMDTDGCIGDDSHMEYDTTSQRLAHDVVWIVRSLGGVALVKAGIKAASYRDENGEKVRCRDCYRVTVRLPFNPFLVAHKASRWVNPTRTPSTRRYLTRFIASIEPDGDEEAMCVEVEHPSGCYLTRDFIVTHNTTVLAWIAWNFLLTRPHPKIAATSITGDNLSDGLWTELAKWQAKSPLLQAAFTWTKTRIFANDHPETWWMAARTWPRTGDREAQADTLGGLHADYILFLLDETGGVPDAVMVAAEAALSTGIESHIVQAGNPTALEGPLYMAHRHRDLWYVIEITGDPDDPKRSPRVSVTWAREQIAQHGRDNPWVLVNVFGKFPPSSLNALIGMDEVEAAQKRYYREDQIGHAALVLGVDVALYGDDASVIFPRRGIQAFPFTKYRNMNSTQGAGVVARLWESMKADGVFIDNTGGFGAGWIDQLRLLGRAPIGIGFAERAHEPMRYANKRAEMYFDAASWIKEGGALPESREIAEALTRTTYTFAKGQLLLEPKADIKSKLGYSPDEADAFCFVAGTMVATPSGQCPIELLAEGDEVLTPFGVSRIAQTWATTATRLTTVRSSYGILVGRPEHKVFVYGYGFVELSALSLTMELSPLSERSEWLASASSTGVMSIGFKTLVAILRHEVPYTARECCTVASGRSAMGQSRKDMKSTTRTGIGETLRSTISKFFQPAIMPPFIQRSEASSPRTKKLKRAIFAWLGTKRLSGIRLPRGFNGIQTTARRLGKIASRLVAYASSAVSRFGRIFQPGPSFALSPAQTETLTENSSPPFAPVIGVARPSLPTDITQRRVVPISVETVSVPPTSVYNLTLETDNAYYANGILVFNCLTFAEPISPSARVAGKPRHQADYDPFASLDRAVERSYKGSYDPYGGGR